ncbi:AAA family ATPase [Streptomyces pseudovenezuelae]|uniref:Energy-coupling factor transporter ATP-binding protein EcfA2 n=1 Tax=Streptomyces pseudovenezuelae TaxID=67350 RepID=A0ABT6LEV9_9ACTN|nr:AAA family ATPase [Streptomyces pseudovenezuelae]MDH6214136.1 energy-coupling factor transporter ATP-binding protein EcfA2 [Streptomyces pseudovenezuelae]
MPGVLRLSKLNLLFGMNDSGKTKLLHLLRSLSSPHLLMEFPADLSCAITWFDPELRKAIVDVRGQWLEYRVDDRRVALPPRPYRVLSFGPGTYKGLRASSVPGIAEFLGVDFWTARTVIANMPVLLPDVVSRVRFYGDDVKVSYREEAFGEEKLGEVVVWFYALAVFAELQARAEPTILVLDEPFNFLHPIAQRHVLELFESATWTFQVILAEHSPTAYERRHHGWSATVLLPEGGRRSRISQEDVDLERIGGG